MEGGTPRSAVVIAGGWTGKTGTGGTIEGGAGRASGAGAGGFEPLATAAAIVVKITGVRGCMLRG
jgi:hypothetical protein